MPMDWADWAPRVVALLGTAGLGGMVVAVLGYRRDMQTLQLQRETAREQAESRAHDLAVQWLESSARQANDIKNDTITLMRQELQELRAAVAELPGLRAAMEDCRAREAALRAEMQALRAEVAALRTHLERA